MRRCLKSPLNQVVAVVVLQLLAAAALYGCCRAAYYLLSKTWLDDADQSRNGMTEVLEDAVCFAPSGEEKLWQIQQLAAAAPEELIHFYAPVYVLPRTDSEGQPIPSVFSCRELSAACIRRDEAGHVKADVEGKPRVYAMYREGNLAVPARAQLIYLAWFPAMVHQDAATPAGPAFQAVVVRITLDRDHLPLVYETGLLGDTSRRLFVSQRLEQAAVRHFGRPLPGRSYCIEQRKDSHCKREVVGIFDEQAEDPGRMAVVLDPWSLRVVALRSADRWRIFARHGGRKYALADYDALFALPVLGSERRASLFRVGMHGIGWGAAGGHAMPHLEHAAADQVSCWCRELRLPPGLLGSPPLDKTPPVHDNSPR